VDRGNRHAAEVRWLPPPSLPVREHAQVLDRRKDRPWPFLYTYGKDGSVSVNRGAKKTSYEEATEIGEALV
jgi:hypothetical protein